MVHFLLSNKSLSVLVIMILALGGCSQAERKSQPLPLKLSLATMMTPYSGLLAIADEKGYFKEEGLELSMDFHPSGRACMEAVIRGEAQVGTVADVAFATKIIDEPSLRVLASIGTTTGSEIIARKDRNIQNPSDLMGKKVGFSSGTTGDYFLYAFLAIHQLSHKDIILVDIPVSRQIDALVNGEVDAVSVFDIYTFEVKDRLGENAVSWDSQNKLAYHWLLVTTEGQTQSPEPIKRLLKSLVRAKDFARANEVEAKNIISQKWRLNPLLVQQAWPKTRLNVSLGQSIITSLQHYAQWHREKVGKPEEPPDVLKLLVTNILDEVDSQLVTIYR